MDNLETRTLAKEDPRTLLEQTRRDRTALDECQLEANLFLHLRAQWAYRLVEAPVFFQFRTRGGAHVPIAIRGRRGMLGVIPLEDENEATSALGSANSFLKHYMNSKVILTHPWKTQRLINDRVLLAPLLQVV